MTNSTTPKPATDKQIAFLRRLVSERAALVDPAVASATLALDYADNDHTLASAEVSSYIDALLDIKAPAAGSSASFTPRPITDKQAAFLAKLRQERGLSADGITRLNSKEASAEIETLKDTPKAKANTAPAVPARKLASNAAFYPTLVGTEFHTAVADGGATYRVAEDFGATVRIERVPDDRDNYRDDFLLDGGIVGRDLVERKVALDR